MAELVLLVVAHLGPQRGKRVRRRGMEDGERAVPGVVVRQGLPLLRNLLLLPDRLVLVVHETMAIGVHQGRRVSRGIEVAVEREQSSTRDRVGQGGGAAVGIVRYIRQSNQVPRGFSVLVRLSSLWVSESRLGSLSRQ